MYNIRKKAYIQCETTDETVIKISSIKIKRQGGDY